jgi:putative two-component system response regulator
MDVVIPLVLHHHERWDGSGYPSGLKGEDIPLGARIIAVLDAYYAMITPRPFRPAFPIEHVVQELQRSAGIRYDPAVVHEFIEVVYRGR